MKVGERWLDDEGQDYFTFRGLLLFGILFGGLVVYSLFDLLFLALGREGTGNVTDAYVFQNRRSRSVMMEWEFKDHVGNKRQGKIDLGDSVPLPRAGDEIPIQYLPAWLLDTPDASRPLRPTNWPLTGLTAASSAGLSFFVYRLIAASGESANMRRRAIR